MPRTISTHLNFTGGMLDPNLRGRVDLDIYHRGAQRVENFLVTPQGALVKRRGFKWVQNGKSTTKGSILIPFVFSTTQAYMLEFGDLHMRVYMNQAPVGTTVDSQRSSCDGIPSGFGWDAFNVDAADKVEGAGAWWATCTGETWASQAAVSQDFGGGSGQDWSVYDYLTVNLKTDKPYDPDLSWYFVWGEDGGALTDHAIEIGHPGVGAWQKLWVDLRDVPAADRNDVRYWGILWVSPYHQIELTDFYLKVDDLRGYKFTPTEIVTPYTEAQLRDLRYCQSSNTLYLAHPSHAPRKITRTGHTTWELSTLRFDPPPTAEIIEKPDCSIAAAAATGTSINFTLATSGPPGTWRFQAGDVGRKLVSGTGVAAITSISSSTVAVCDILYDWPGTGAIATGSWEVQISPNTRLLVSGPNRKGATTTLKADVGGSPVVTFRSSYVGKYLFVHKGIVKITRYISSSEIKGINLRARGGSDNAWDWTIEEPMWDAVQGWPRIVTFWEQRLMFGGSPTYPHMLWFSSTGLFENQGRGSEDADAIHYNLVANDVHTMRWAVPSRVLMVGTNSGVWKVASSTQDEPVTPSNIAARPDNNVGSANIQGLKDNANVLFVAAGGKHFWEIGYDFAQDGYVANNLSDISSELFTNAVASAMQRKPYTIAWICANGKLFGLTVNRREKVLGWHKHSTLAPSSIHEVVEGSGYPEATPDPRYSVAFTDVAVLPTEGMDDELWAVFAVTDEVLGNYYAIGVIPPEDSGAYLDLYYEWHYSTHWLNNVFAYKDFPIGVQCGGVPYLDLSVTSSGLLYLPNLGSPVFVGIPYQAVLQTMPLDMIMASGMTTQAIDKRLVEINAKVRNTLLAHFAAQADNVVGPFIEVPWRFATDNIDAVAALRTGDIRHIVVGASGREIAAWVKSWMPTPMTLLGISPIWTVEGELDFGSKS